MPPKKGRRLQIGNSQSQNLLEFRPPSVALTTTRRTLGKKKVAKQITLPVTTIVAAKPRPLPVAAVTGRRNGPDIVELVDPTNKKRRIAYPKPITARSALENKIKNQRNLTRKKVSIALAKIKSRHAPKNTPIVVEVVEPPTTVRRAPPLPVAAVTGKRRGSLLESDVLKKMKFSQPTRRIAHPKRLKPTILELSTLLDKVNLNQKVPLQIEIPTQESSPMDVSSPYLTPMSPSYLTPRASISSPTPMESRVVIPELKKINSNSKVNKKKMSPIPPPRPKPLVFAIPNSTSFTTLIKKYKRIPKAPPRPKVMRSGYKKGPHAMDYVRSFIGLKPRARKSLRKPAAKKRAPAKHPKSIITLRIGKTRVGSERAYKSGHTGKINCVCGSKILAQSEAGHLQSQKHKKYMRR